jgi:hypothetical protein
MQRLQSLMFLFALSSALCQTPSTTLDPYGGTVTGKTYSNDFFGFSYKYPEELISQAESLQSLSKQFASGRAKGDPNVVEQMAAVYRKQRILLSASSAASSQGQILVGQAPLGLDVPSNRSGPMSRQRPAGPPISTESMNHQFKGVLTIRALPWSGNAFDSNSFYREIEAELRQHTPEVKTLSAPSAITIARQEFSRAAYERTWGSNGHEVRSEVSAYVTTRNGYQLFFLFESDSPHDLGELEKSLNTLSFTP